MPPTKVRVTKHDIADGKRCHAGQCPVAIALSRHVKDSGHWQVGPFDAATWPPRDGKRLSVKLPHEVRRWLLDYDAAKPVAPIEFEVEVTEVPCERPL